MNSDTREISVFKSINYCLYGEKQYINIMLTHEIQINHMTRIKYMIGAIKKKLSALLSKV